jgi:DNA repair protein RecN (Recombination protein N)
MAKLDGSVSNIAASIAEAEVLLADIVSELRAHADTLDADPRGLIDIEQRLDTLYRLRKKYKAKSADALLEKLAQLEAELESLTNAEAEVTRLSNHRSAITKDIRAVCDAMHATRTTAAQTVSRDIEAVLQQLGMAKARFQITTEQGSTISAHGNTNVEFEIAPNAGEPMKPLARIASGGEMSRTMLAIKTVLHDAGGTPTVIFDEVDSGVSGRTAQQVAVKLAELARTRQILCITHLPQIAAMADTHYLISKAEANNRTTTTVAQLCNDGITDELARLIGGAHITDATKKAAREIKSQAAELKLANS